MNDVLNLLFKDGGLVSEKEQVMLFLRNAKTQCLCSATFAKMLESRKKPACTYYRIATGAVQQNEASLVLSQHSFQTFNSVSYLFTPVPRQSSAHVSFIPADYTSHSFFLLHTVIESATVACTGGQAQAQEILASNFWRNN